MLNAWKRLDKILSKFAMKKLSASGDWDRFIVWKQLQKDYTDDIENSYYSI